MTKYNPDEDYEDDDMAVKKVPLETGYQDEILIQKLTTVGSVHASSMGSKPMVVAAFEVVGEYLNDAAGKADSEPEEVQFDYLGVTFRGSFGERDQ